MANGKAQAAKEKGNAAFKTGDYPIAIGHYTAAILADRKDPTFPLNRAAAYLKLGKNEDAERDCSTVLDLSPNNVKALFRRGQARLGVGKLVEAQSDLRQALELEPGNAAVKEELTKLADVLERTKTKGKATDTPPVHSSTAHPKRRRVPITIVEPAGVPSAKIKDTPSTQPTSEPQIPSAISPPKPDIDTLQPVSSRSLKASPTSSSSTPSNTPPNPSPPPVTQPQPKPTSFKEAKQARESAKSGKVGGGIFRASGASTIFPTRESPSLPTESRGLTPKGDLVTENDGTMATPPAAQTTSPQIVVKAPANLFEFVKAWTSAVNVEEKWQLINSIPPASIPSLCKTSLEPAMLASILDVFLAVLNANTREKIQEYMDNLARIPRFGTLVLFLSKQEKEVARDVWRGLSVERPTGVWSVVA